MNAEKEAEYRYLANNEALKEVFEVLEKDTFEELLRLPVWAGQKRKAALIQRVQVIRDVRARIKLLAMQQPDVQQVV